MLKALDVHIVRGEPGGVAKSEDMSFDDMQPDWLLLYGSTVLLVHGVCWAV